MESDEQRANVPVMESDELEQEMTGLVSRYLASVTSQLTVEKADSDAGRLALATSLSAATRASAAVVGRLQGQMFAATMQLERMRAQRAGELDALRQELAAATTQRETPEVELLKRDLASVTDRLLAERRDFEAEKAALELEVADLDGTEAKLAAQAAEAELAIEAEEAEHARERRLLQESLRERLAHAEGLASAQYVHAQVQGRLDHLRAMWEVERANLLGEIRRSAIADDGVDEEQGMSAGEAAEAAAARAEELEELEAAMAGARAELGECLRAQAAERAALTSELEDASYASCGCGAYGSGGSSADGGGGGGGCGGGGGGGGGGERGGGCGAPQHLRLANESEALLSRAQITLARLHGSLML